MKLTKARITDFQSIRDSNEFDIGDVTCLVGKNEAGKTALLQAIYKLNPIVTADEGYNVIDDYPRSDVTAYENAIEEGERAHADVATLTFLLDEVEAGEIAELFGPDALISRVITLSRAYEGDFVYSIDVDEDSAMRHIRSLQATAVAEDVDPAPEITLLESIDRAGSLENYIWEEILEARVPTFMYFDEYYQLRGCDNIESLQARLVAHELASPDHPLLGLINAAGLDLNTLLEPGRTRNLKNKLEGAGNHLTKSIVRYWSQNKNLQMRFDVHPAQPDDPEGMRDGTNIWAEVYDTSHMVSTEIGTRSRGFVWFFSFLAWYGDVQREEQNVILLLDEPGLSLHGKAQADLLRYFEEELAPHHQVIYSTHSPFMVDPTRFDRVRIVQDRSVDADTDLPEDATGTKVTTNVLEAADDSLFPLQGALGYDIAQTLFIGPNSLIVEGISDLLYLQVMTGELQAAGREGLDERWTITPVGGSGKVPTFVALLGSQKMLNIAALIDFQEQDAQDIENLWKRKLIKKAHVITYSDLIGAREADVEDVLGVAFFLMLVNAEYTSSLSRPITENALKSRKPRINDRLRAYFSENTLKGGAKFSHYRPARYLIENAGKLTVPADVLDRFETICRAVNKLLARA